MPCLMLNGKKYTGGGGGSSERYIYSGTSAPSQSLGENNSIYMLYDLTCIKSVYGKINGNWVPFPTGSSGGSSFNPLSITERDTAISTITVTDTSS